MRELGSPRDRRKKTGLLGFEPGTLIVRRRCQFNNHWTRLTAKVSSVSLNIICPSLLNCVEVLLNLVKLKFDLTAVRTESMRHSHFHICFIQLPKTSTSNFLKSLGQIYSIDQLSSFLWTLGIVKIVKSHCKEVSAHGTLANWCQNELKMKRIDPIALQNVGIAQSNRTWG